MQFDRLSIKKHIWAQNILVKITKDELWLCAVQTHITPQAGNKATEQPTAKKQGDVLDLGGGREEGRQFAGDPEHRS